MSRAKQVEPEPDVLIRNEGSIFLFYLQSAAAKKWVKKYVGAESTYFGGALVVEHRFAQDLAEGMTEGGLLVQ